MPPSGHSSSSSTSSSSSSSSSSGGGYDSGYSRSFGGSGRSKRSFSAGRMTMRHRDISSYDASDGIVRSRTSGRNLGSGRSERSFSGSGRQTSELQHSTPDNHSPYAQPYEDDHKFYTDDYDSSRYAQDNYDMVDEITDSYAYNNEDYCYDRDLDYERRILAGSNVNNPDGNDEEGDWYENWKKSYPGNQQQGTIKEAINQFVAGYGRDYKSMFRDVLKFCVSLAIILAIIVITGRVIVRDSRPNNSYSNQGYYSNNDDYNDIISNTELFGEVFGGRFIDDNTVGITQSIRDSHNIEFVWDSNYESYKVQGSKDDWVWFNTDVSPNLWQYWYGDISKDYGEYGWMEYHYDTNEWYIEASKGNWQKVDTSKYNVNKLWHFDNPYGERMN